MNRVAVAQELVKLAKQVQAEEPESLTQATIVFSGSWRHPEGYIVTAEFRSWETGNEVKENFRAKNLQDAFNRLSKLESEHHK